MTKQDAPIALAKLGLDVGLMTNSLEEHQSMLAKLGVPYDHLLKVGGGIHQHRYKCGQSILKVNSNRSVLGTGIGGYVGVRFVADVDDPVTFTSPDGVAMMAVPTGVDGISGVEVTIATPDVARAARFLTNALGAVDVGDRFAIGETLIVVEHDPGRARSAGRSHLGIRYLTVQVGNVEHEHSRITSLGYGEGMAPVRLGDVAVISFVIDDDGNWIELSQLLDNR